MQWSDIAAIFFVSPTKTTSISSFRHQCVCLSGVCNSSLHSLSSCRVFGDETDIKTLFVIGGSGRRRLTFSLSRWQLEDHHFSSSPFQRKAWRREQHTILGPIETCEGLPLLFFPFRLFTVLSLPPLFCFLISPSLLLFLLQSRLDFAGEEEDRRGMIIVEANS